MFASPVVLRKRVRTGVRRAVLAAAPVALPYACMACQDVGECPVYVHDMFSHVTPCGCAKGIALVAASESELCAGEPAEVGPDLWPCY